MPTGCCLSYCRNNRDNTKSLGISYHRFPKNRAIKAKWVTFCGQTTIHESSRICSVHFKRSDFVRDLQNELIGNPPRKILKEDAVPSFLYNAGEDSDIDDENECVVDDIFKKIAENEDRRRNEVNKILEEYSQSTQNIQDKCTQTMQQTTDINNYKKMYEKLRLQHVALKSEHQKLKEENTMLKKKLKSCESQIKINKSKVHSMQINENKMNNILSQVLSKNQLSLLLHKKKRVNWNRDEMSLAFTLRFYSKKSYIYLKKNLNYPLPSLASLRRWAMDIQMRHGVLYDILCLLRLRGEELSNKERCVVLQFGEVKLKNIVEYDSVNDEIVGPFSQMQVVMAKALFANWKQPIYVDFDKKITKDLLMDVITNLHKINYNVIACVSDCGANNIELWKELNVDVNKTFFKHPAMESNVYVFANIAHLLKLLRNWFLDTGFKLDNGTTITKKPLEDLVKLTDSDLNVCCKINENHITSENIARHDVRLAEELLSNTTAAALRYNNLEGDQNEISALASFIELVSAWFDVFNSYTATDSSPFKCGYGVKLVEQNSTLDNMKETVSAMQPVGKDEPQIFQKGILISINSLKMLFADMMDKFSISYILTSRLNHDSLEKFFYQLRDIEGSHDHPSPVNAFNKIKVMILGKSSGISQANTSTEDQVQDEYIVASMFKKADINSRQKIVQEDPGTTNISNSASEQLPPDLHVNIVDDSKQDTPNDALEYIAGYIADKYEHKYPFLGSHRHQLDNEHNYSRFSCEDHLPNGLIKPSEEWFTAVKKFDKLFLKYHMTKDDTLYRKGKNVTKKLVKKIHEKHDVPIEVIQTFVKQRTVIRINYVNSKKSISRKRKTKENDDELRSKQMKNF